MKTFTYVITNKDGIHGRPTGNLVKLAKSFKCSITIECKGVSNDLTKLMAVMSMGVKRGDTVNVYTDGEDEEIAFNAMQEFFRQNL